MDDGDTADLALLIHYVATIEGIDRIRYTTSHPVEFSDSLIEAYATVPELVSHLHLPIQSGSDRILMMMKRGHTALEYNTRFASYAKFGLISVFLPISLSDFREKPMLILRPR